MVNTVSFLLPLYRPIYSTTKAFTPTSIYFKTGTATVPLHFSGLPPYNASERIERLFINMSGYFRDTNWATTMDATIAAAIQDPKVMQSSTNLLDFLAKAYREDFLSCAQNMQPWCKLFTEDEFQQLNQIKSCAEMLSLVDQKAAALESRNKQGDDPVPGWDRKDLLLYLSYFLFGTKRTVDDGYASTGIEGQYEPYQQQALTLMGANSLSEAQGKSHEMTVQIKHEKIPLTLTLWHQQTKKLRWFNCSTQSIQKVLKRVESLYQDTQNLTPAPKNATAIIKNVAKMHWLLVQAMPYLRGSAGIADMFTKAVFDSKNIKTSAWKDGLAPDLEAYTREMSDFVEAYPSFFKVEPDFIQQKGFNQFSQIG